MTVPMNSANANPASMADYNKAIRDHIVHSSVDLTQQIFAQTYTNYVAGQALTINVTPRNVGLVKRFVVKCEATVAQGVAETQTKSAMGGANLLSTVILTDLNNQERVHTTGWHLHYLASMRRQAAFGAAYANSDPSGIGANWTLNNTPSPLTTAKTLRWFYEVPVAYSDTDLSGAIWAGVTNAVFNLQLTVNPNFFVTNAGNPTQAVYQSSSTQLGVISSLTITVYQNMLDQLPLDPKTGKVLLPPKDLEWVYLLNQASAAGLVANQDAPNPYANWRNFMSTLCIYDNAGVLNLGTDINYFALQSANFTNLWKFDPYYAALLTRMQINDDLPAGTYFFSHRHKPINTLQWGNMQFIVQPSAVTSSASQLLFGYESLALQGVMAGAGGILP